MKLGRIEIRIESDQFPTDRIQIREVRGRERISRLFEFDLEIVVPVDAGLDPRGVAGAIAALVFTEDGVERRRVHGMIAEVVDMLGSETELRAYRLRLVPRAWRLGLVRMQEIYMDRTLQQIIEQKLRLVGLEGDSQFFLHGKDEPREFVVQFEESDLAFVSRLAEHVGWSFYFDHTEGFDRIVFTDHGGGFHPVEGAETATFQPRGDRTDIYRLDATTRLVPAMYAVGDFDYRAPQVDLSSICELEAGYGGGVIEYGTNYRTGEDGTRFARIRAEEHNASALVFRGEAALCTLTAGARFTLLGHPRLDDLEMLVVGVEHRANQVVFGDGGGAEAGYHAVFECIPAAVQYRPPRLTPRPRIHGVMSGIIEADPGMETEQAWIDEHGRYLVRMLFDTAAPGERKASLPIRMAQAHSGPGYGIHFPLRPGAEVLVGFFGGDPDRPVIVGSVPNALTPTPVVDRLATRHRIRTWSGVMLEIDDGG